MKQNKYKNLLIIGSVIAVLALIGTIVGDPKEDAGKKQPADTLSQKQKDSVERRALIESAFSGWDGSQKNLVELVKKNMHNPKSFEHVETRFFDLGDSTIVVTMTYRGTNAYGGVVTNSIKAETTLDGSIVKVFE